MAFSNYLTSLPRVALFLPSSLKVYYPGKFLLVSTLGSGIPNKRTERINRSKILLACPRDHALQARLLNEAPFRRFSESFHLTSSSILCDRDLLVCKVGSHGKMKCEKEILLLQALKTGLCSPPKGKGNLDEMRDLP
ncbi:hypothetical protein V6N11_041453 [Hibiscus sabdariffa]|uniref:Uncharacterized protein n=1 Tax=Hibiscus sabdariffa TaxID=183260 RepID=A0ABR2RKQ2_9ROSI